MGAVSPARRRLLFKRGAPVVAPKAVPRHEKHDDAAA
jgi:hypothetical protein